MKPSVLLFNSPIRQKKRDPLEVENLYPRIGIASIAACLQENGIEVHIIDPEAEGLDSNGVKGRISKTSPGIVGIPAYTEEVCDAAYTAGLVKEIDPEIVTVIGGPHASAIPSETLEEFRAFDIAVTGEGELTLLDIAMGERLEGIKGIAFRDENIVVNEKRPLISSLDCLPFPAWHLHQTDRYRGSGLTSGFRKKRVDLEIPVESARGCPFNCIFCYRVCDNIRFKSPKRVADEVEWVISEFGATKIHFTEGTFAVNKKIAIEMCDELIGRGLNKKITWSSGARAELTDMELLTIMKRSGCAYLGFGAESGDNKILKIIHKGITAEQIERAFELCKEIGIETEANFIIGHPFESEETVNRTIDFALSLQADRATFAILVPFPGTVVRQMAEDNIGGLKILSNDWSMYGKQAGGPLELDQLPLGKLIGLQTKAYRKFYLRPSRFLKFASLLSFNRVLYSLKRFLANKG